MNFYNETEVRALLARHGFRFSKSMGQNFLIDPAVPRRMAEASGAGPGVGVLEIGPGIGPLTAELSARADRVTAVELDRSLLPVLDETLAGCANVEILSGDVLRLDLSALAAEKFAGLTPVVCANLPYNITTPVLTLLAHTPCFGRITVLVQREVAHRICAAPGDPDCSAFSLLMQYELEPEILFDVPPACFLPAPKVTSSVLRCTRRQRPAVAVADEALFFRCLRGAFALRRKTLVNSLSSVGFDREAVRRAMEQCGFPPDVRGERLGLADFARLSDTLLNSQP